MIRKILRIIAYIFAGMLFLLGVLIYAYPFINSSMLSKNTEETLVQFRTVRQEAQRQKQTSDGESSINTGSNFNNLYEDMRKYNLNIYKNRQEDLKDAWSYEQSVFDLSGYGLYGAVAELRIPKMNVDLPIYLGATWSNMGKGAAQLGQTSMPIGGNNTNCVIAAHRGSSGGKFFLDIEQLEPGDEVYIDNLWETLTYQVESIEIISPQDTEKIHIRENKDMVTLITCHPYPYNYQRYVVYCTRYNEETENSETSENSEPKESAAEVSRESDVSNAEVTNIGNSQTFMLFENSLYIFVPAALILLALCLFRHKKR
ncbi:MAG: class C sortase [Acutalibacteraceae bacterium]